MDNPDLQRSILLLLPVSIWMSLFLWRRYTNLEYASSLLGFLFYFFSALIIHIWLQDHDIWKFNIKDAEFYGVPIDFIIGQAALLPILFLVLRKMSIWLQMVAIYVLYAHSNMVIAEPKMGYGIVLLYLFALLPAYLLAKWTVQNKYLYARSILQTSIWACILLWFFPSAIFQNTTYDWQINKIFLPLMLIPLFILLSALHQFATEGQGTAFPYDPPKNLVTHGIYAYISNPMQVGICLMMALWGVVLGCSLISLSSLIAVLLFIAYDHICSGSCSIGENNPNWIHYQKAVPKWIPRLTAWNADAANKK